MRDEGGPLDAGGQVQASNHYKLLSSKSADPKHLGAEIGMIAVLHTWGQNLFHHPHVHCIVMGGGPVSRW